MMTDGQTTTANYTCSTGYTLSGQGFLTCQQDATWNYGIPTCVQCQSLNTFSSVVVSMTTDGHVTTATFTCVTGYSKTGPDSRTCQSDGTWNSTTPTCSCNDPAMIQNGVVIANGKTANYTCSLGFTLSGTWTRTCLNDGTGWSGFDPSCVLCPTLTNPTGGQITLSTSGTVTSATYTCESGYTLSGQSSITCQSTGTWETLSICAQCEQLQTPNSGTVSISTTGSVSMATYTCASGYDMNGVASRTCSADGTWTSTAPTCTCQSPDQPTNGQVTDDGQTAMYTCNTGFSLDGQSTRMCASNGTGWIGNDPVCVKCANLSTIDGGSSVLSTDGLQTTSSYTCNNGYTLNGVRSMTCNSSGLWETTEPECVLCPTLTDPSSGSVTITTDGYTSTADYSCATGYYVDGTSSFNCLTTGQWAYSSPTCKCNLPSTPADGVVSVSDTVHGQRANYSCSTGYTLFGLSSRLCLTNGTGWEGADPTCTSCTLSSTPVETFAVLSTNGVVTIITYTCAQNYSLSGTSVQVCQSNGTWSDSVPTCTQCSAIAVPDGGDVVIETNGLTTTASFTCNVGYTLNGLRELSCLSTGSWDGTEPICVQCPTLSDPSSGNVSTSTDGYITTAAFTCVSGYYLSGLTSISCQTNGQWNGDTPTCECNFPMSPANGHVSVSTDGTVAQYTCNTNYTLSGSATRVCQTDGTGWTGTEPTCSSCTISSTPAETSAVLSTNGVVTMITYTCAQNYSLSGTSVQVCQSDGTWSDSEPTCTLCSPITSPIGGNVAMETDGLTTSVSYTCNDGYTLDGMRGLSCLSNGTWNSSQPICVQCPTLTNPSSGSVSTTTDGYVTMATFNCVSGYYLSGRTSVSCQTNGQWDGDSPTCECNFPMSPANGHVSVSTDGTVAQYTCTTKFTLSGSATRVCQTDGTGWTGTEPTCVACSIVEPVLPLSAAFSTSGSVTSATYSCAVNYTLIGTSIQTCNSNGTWTDTPPTCEPCDAKVPLASGSISFTTNGLITQATFVCATGYSLNSTGTVSTCLSNGSWDQADPVCLCNSPTAPSNGDINLSSDGRVANYSCATGYTLQGPAERVCQNDGTGWSGTDPICELIAAASAASTEDGSTFPIHIALFIVLLIAIVVLIGLVAFCAYRRFKGDKNTSKIAATYDGNLPVAGPEREKSFGSDKISKDVENGKALLIKPTDKKLTFDVRNLTPTPPHEVPNIKFDSDRPTQIMIRKETPTKARALPPRPSATSTSVPLTSVRLPKLVSRPPQSHELPRQKRRRKKKPPAQENLLSGSSGSSTPIDIKLTRESTSELLSTAEFDYIQPVYCHEAQTPEPVRANTAMSQASKSRSRPRTSKRRQADKKEQVDTSDGT